MTAPHLFSPFLLAFVECFTAPGFAHFCHFILAHAKLLGLPHCVSETLRLTRWHECVHWTTPYAFLSKGRFSCSALSRALFTLLVQQLPLSEDLVLVLDDTLVKKWGRRFFGLGVYRDPTDKCPGASKRRVYGHCWVVLGLLVRRGKKWLCFPVGGLLFIQQKVCPAGWEFLTKIDLASRLLRRLDPSSWRVTLLVDNLYAKKAILQTLRETCLEGILVSRLRSNAALYLPPTAPKKPRRGRPRLRGKKVTAQGLWRQHRRRRELAVQIYGKNVTVNAVVATLIPSRTLGQDPIRVVICPQRSGKLNIFFSSDPEMAPERILELYGARWEIECLFKEIKTHGGLGDYRHRGFRPIKRHVTLCLLASSLLRLLTLKAPEIAALTAEPWWHPKGIPSVTRARRALARLNIVHVPDFQPKPTKNRRPKSDASRHKGISQAA